MTDDPGDVDDRDLPWAIERLDPRCPSCGRSPIPPPFAVYENVVSHAVPLRSQLDTRVRCVDCPWCRCQYRAMFYRRQQRIGVDVTTPSA